jgi:hypothetical protein
MESSWFRGKNENEKGQQVAALEFLFAGAPQDPVSSAVM